MAGFNITTTQLSSSLQNIQSRYIRIELLNQNFQTVNQLEGICTSGSISIDANSDVRRTGSIVLVVTNSDFEVTVGGQIWLERYVKVWVGTMSLQTGKIEYTNCGVFIIDAPNYQYDPSTNTLTLSLLDLMAKLTGIRNGYVKGMTVIFSAGENIREAIIDILELVGITKYVVEEAPSPGTIPNDLEFNQGSTVYDLLAGLRDIYPNYEMFFDADGVFYYKPIPTGENDPIYIDDTLWSNIVLSEQIDVNFQDVKNVIEVYGKTHDPAHYSTSTTVNTASNLIQLTISSVSAYTEDMIYGFTLTDNPGYTGYNLRIGSLATLPILLDDGKTPATIEAESGEIYYCVQYKGTYWNWLGHLQAYGYAQDDNPDSPFYVGGQVGPIRIPLFGGEYDNINSDNLALQRAQYELWKRTNLNSTLALSCVPVPWLDVNIKVQYTQQRNNTTAQYIIKSINFGLGPSDSMSISLITFYPDSPNIVN